MAILVSISIKKFVHYDKKPEQAKMFMAPNSLSHRRGCVNKPKITRVPMDHCYQTLHSVGKDNAL